MGIKYKPIGEKILVLPKERDNKTKAGLIMVAEDNSTPDYGTIVEKGDVVTEVNIGDTVMYEHGSGKLISIDDTKYVLLDCSCNGTVLCTANTPTD